MDRSMIKCHLLVMFGYFYYVSKQTRVSNNNNLATLIPRIKIATLRLFGKLGLFQKFLQVKEEDEQSIQTNKIYRLGKMSNVA
jgi:hypothetical protein